MASFLFSNCRTSVHFDNTHLKLSTHAYFKVRFQSMLIKYENSKKCISMTLSLMKSIHSKSDIIRALFCC